MLRNGSRSFVALLLATGAVLTGCDQARDSNPAAVAGLPNFSPAAGGVRVSPPRAARAVPTSPAELVAAMQTAYQSRDFALLSALLSDAPGAQFQFEGLTPPAPPANSWGRGDECRIHARMFDPAAIPPGDAPLPVELWMTSIDASFVQMSPFVDRPDLYRDPLGNRPGLDPSRWRAHAAEFATIAFFETQGETDYRVDARVLFVVIEDLAPGAGPAKKFRLYRWEEWTSAGASTAETRSWSSVKSLYR